MTPPKLPGWMRLAAVLILVPPVVAVLAFGTGRLHGSHRNLVPLTTLGAILALLILAGHALRFLPQSLSPPKGQWGAVLITVVAAILVGVYFLRVLPLLRMPYDVASWSEPMFLVDADKLHTGTPLYLPPEDGNSNSYTFGAPALTYFLAWLLRHPTSVVLYRFIQQLYLVLAALFGAAATWRLGRLISPERRAGPSKVWFAFFALALFLFATNSNTARQNVYLHNEPLGWLASAVAFWLLMEYAVTRRAYWFYALAVMPALAFLVKQYLAVWAVIYLVFLWFDGGIPVRRVVMFGVATFALIGGTIGLCYAAWGASFYFWVFATMSGFTLSFQWLVERFVEVGWELALGLGASWILLRTQDLQRVLGVILGWVVLVVTAVYIMALAPYPTYFGSATLVGGCFFLAVVWKFWSEENYPQTPAQAWLHFALGVALVIAVLAGLGHPHLQVWQNTPDLARYVGQIEREFAGQNVSRVLLDEGDWIYLREGVVMKDRQAILTTPRIARLDGMMERVRQHYYQKILVHTLSDGTYLYDLALDRGIQRNLLQHYHEVRRIPGVRDLSVHYGFLMLGDIIVLEPQSTATALPGD